MKKIAVIDADLIGRKKHRFPNLCCLKISGYHKSCGDNVTLKFDCAGLEFFDKVYIAKVFTDTVIPMGGGLFNINPLELPNVEYGGTGFFYDKAKPLPYEIEHSMPDYNLYNEWLARVDNGKDFKAYKDYSIGFLTRGCFRHCPFCVNRRSNKVIAHSPLNEFLDTSRRKICLLDDNFFGYEDWRTLLEQLQDTNKPFHFKQGLDVRLLDDEKATVLFKSKYDGDFIFAFDDWADAPIIEEKLKLIRRHYKTSRKVKFYVLCAYDFSGKYDKNFWLNDLENTCRRLKLLNQYKCLAYVMRFNRYLDSPYKSVYCTLAEYANQPAFFFRMPFDEFATARRKSINPIVHELNRKFFEVY